MFVKNAYVLGNARGTTVGIAPYAHLSNEDGVLGAGSVGDCNCYLSLNFKSRNQMCRAARSGISTDVQAMSGPQ